MKPVKTMNKRNEFLESGKTLILLDETTIGYGRALMRPLSLSIRQGNFWGVVGPNGAGKTTLVKTILGLLRPSKGQVAFPSGKPRIGYVPQRHVLNTDYPLSAFDVVLMGRYPRLGVGRSPGLKDRERAMEEIERVGLGELSTRRFSSLSGGQQQRMLIARALAADPDMLILDEPTTGMDLPGETDILDFLSRLHQAEGKTLLMIGHHIGSVIRVVDHLCLINKDADMFESGPLDEMLDTRRLSSCYGRSIAVSGTGRDLHVTAQEVDHG